MASVPFPIRFGMSGPANPNSGKDDITSFSCPLVRSSTLGKKKLSATLQNDKARLRHACWMVMFCPVLTNGVGLVIFAFSRRPL